jgi:hypothetical protein
MIQRRPWVVLGGLILLTAILAAALTGRGGAGDSPSHESSSDARNGTSALRLFAQALGYRTRAIEGEFHQAASPGLLFVFSPLTQSGFSSAQSGQLLTWVSAGGVLVYAAETGDAQLDRTLALQRRPDRVDANTHPSAPVLQGLQHIQGATEAQPFRAQPRQVPLLRNARNDVLALTWSLGQGRVVALADPLVLCNGYLGSADNGRFAADLLALAPAGSTVLFDEFHHGLQSGGSSQTAWTATPWGAALLWAVLIVVVGLAMRGRAFGPRVPLRRAGERSSAEYATAVGALLRRAGARGVTLERLDSATRRLLGERLGLGGAPGTAAFFDALQRRAPLLGQAVGEVERRLPDGSQSDAALLDVAHRLHALAFPAAGGRGSA